MRIVNITYSTDTLFGRRTFSMQYVGVTNTRALALFNANIRPKLRKARLLRITRYR